MLERVFHTALFLTITSAIASGDIDWRLFLTAFVSLHLAGYSVGSCLLRDFQHLTLRWCLHSATILVSKRYSCSGRYGFLEPSTYCPVGSVRQILPRGRFRREALVPGTCGDSGQLTDTYSSSTSLFGRSGLDQGML